jgi:hypothetical protein
MKEEEEQQKSLQQQDNNNNKEPLVIRLIHANRKAGREENKGVFEYMRLITKVANERQEEAAIKKGLGENLKPIEYYQEEVVRDLKAMSKEDRYRFLIDHSPISKSTDPNSIEITKQMRRDIDIIWQRHFHNLNNLNNKKVVDSCKIRVLPLMLLLLKRQIQLVLLQRHHNLQNLDRRKTKH